MIIQQLNSSTQSSGNVNAGSAPVKQPAPVVSESSAPVVSPAERDAQVEKVVEHINQAIKSLSSNLNFSVDKETGITVVKVMDTETNQLIRQIPGDEVLSIAKAIDTLQGLIIRQKA